MTVTVFLADPHPRLAPYDPIADRLAANGGRLVLGTCETEADLIAQAGEAGAEVILIAWRRIGGAAVMDALPKVRLMIRLGIGYDQIDDVAATERGIAAGNCPTYCAEEVAEHTIALLYGSARQMVWMHEQLRAGGWTPSKTPIHRIKGQTLGLVGCGSIGSKVAWRARGLGLNVIAYDKFRPDEELRALGVEPVSLDELLERSDFVSLHVPLNAGTRGLLSEGKLAKLKPTAYLINTSRGPVIDQAALTDVLAAGRIAGAALDVFEVEPLDPASPLRKLENVILTPHQAASSEEAIAGLKEELTVNLIDWINTSWSNAVRNEEVRERLRPRT